MEEYQKGTEVEKGTLSGVAQKYTNHYNENGEELKKKGNAKLEEVLRAKGIILNYSSEYVKRNDNKVAVNIISKGTNSQLVISIKDPNSQQIQKIVIGECPQNMSISMITEIRSALQGLKDREWVYDQEKKGKCYFTPEAKKIFIKEELKEKNGATMEIVRTAFTPQEEEELKEWDSKEVYKEGILLYEMEKYIEDMYNRVMTDPKALAELKEKKGPAFQKVKQINEQIEGIKKSIEIFDEEAENMKNSLEERGLVFNYSPNNVRKQKDGNVAWKVKAIKDSSGDLKAEIGLEVKDAQTQKNIPVVIGYCPFNKERLCERNLSDIFNSENNKELNEGRNILTAEGRYKNISEKDKLNFVFTPEGKEIFSTTEKEEREIVKTELTPAENKQRGIKGDFEGAVKYKVLLREIENYKEEAARLENVKEQTIKIEANPNAEIMKSLRKYIGEKHDNKDYVNVDTTVGAIFYNLQALLYKNVDIPNYAYIDLRNILGMSKNALAITTGITKEKYVATSGNYYEDETGYRIETYLKLREVFASGEIGEEQYREELQKIEDPKNIYKKVTEERRTESKKLTNQRNIQKNTSISPNER